jgi:hypothetical protein
VFDPHHHAAAVDIAEFQRHDFGNPEPRGVILIPSERDSSRSIPRNGAGAHSRFGHKAMIGSDHRDLV